MTNQTQTKILDRIDNIIGCNSSWAADMEAALTLYTLDGDAMDQIDWMIDWFEEDGEDRDETIAALNEYVEKHAPSPEDVFEAFALPQRFWGMDEDYVGRLYLELGERTTLAHKAFYFLLDNTNDWIYDNDLGYTTEELVKMATEGAAKFRAQGDEDGVYCAEALECYLENIAAEA